jgi:KDO2-lipid IV(A) lauroyltransferase
VETLKLLTISEKELRKRMRYPDVSFVQKYKDQNQPVIILASHQFNWEWLLAAGNLFMPFPLDFVYQPVNNQFFEKVSLLSRTRFGSYAIKRDEVARESVRRRKMMRGIAIVADQYPGYEHDKKFAATFLNQDSVFFLGANQLATLLQYPAIYMEIRKVKRGYYEAYIVPIAEPPYEKDSEVVVSNYIKAVEKTISAYPSGWLWSHNRWKTRHLNG